MPEHINLVVLISALIYQCITIYYDNYDKEYSVRVYRWFSGKNLFRLVKFALFVNFLLLESKLSFKKLHKQASYTELLCFKAPFTTDRHGWLQVSLLAVGSFIFLFITNHKSIRKNLSLHDYKMVPFFRGFKSYLFSSILFYSTSIFVLYQTFELIQWIDDLLMNFGMSQLDWTKRSVRINFNDYKKGFYFSVIVASVLTFSAADIFFQLRDNFFKKLAIYKVVIVCCIIFFGVLCGSYSITNSYFNINNYDTIARWYNADKQVGIFALRLSSLLLLFYLVSFLSNKIFYNNIIVTFIKGTLTKMRLRVKNNALSDKAYSTMFLAQIGFYILNLTVAEVSILFKEQAVYRTVLDFALVFIVDDYIIIHNYSNKLEKILVAHKWRIAFFNLVLTVGAVATLVSLNLYGYLIVYLTIALLLLFVTETNISRVATA